MDEDIEIFYERSAIKSAVKIQRAFRAFLRARRRAKQRSVHPSRLKAYDRHNPPRGSHKDKDRAQRGERAGYSAHARPKTHSRPTTPPGKFPPSILGAQMPFPQDLKLQPHVPPMPNGHPPPPQPQPRALPRPVTPQEPAPPQIGVHSPQGRAPPVAAPGLAVPDLLRPATGGFMPNPLNALSPSTTPSRSRPKLSTAPVDYGAEII